MIDLIDVMQWTGLSTLAVVVYVLAFNGKSNARRSGPYSVPNWNFHLKKYWAERVLRKKALTDDEKCADFQQFEREPPGSGSDSQLHASQFIFGTDGGGNSLVISLAVGQDGQAEVWLNLRLVDGGLFALPAHPNVQTAKVGAAISEDRFEIAGLTFECLQPFVKWRISFGGLLRHVDGDAGDDGLHFVRFNFFWTMCGHPQHWPADWSNAMKATALANEPWRNGHWLQYLSTNGYAGFDQFGSLFGQVHRTNDDSQATTVELNLPGVRQRRWTPYDQEKVRRSCTIVGACTDGSVYVLGAHSLERNLSNAQFGHVRTPDGHVTAIDATDFHLGDFAEQPAHIPHVANVHFTANGRSFATTIYPRPAAARTLVGIVPHAWSETVLPADVGLNGEHGDGIVRLWYANTVVAPVAAAPVSAVKSPLHTLLRTGGAQLRPTRTKIAYWLSDAGAQSEAIAGGKGASLALLTAALELPDAGTELPFGVPDGFVLGVSAFEWQLGARPAIRAAIEAVEQCAYGRIDGDLREACANAVRLIEADVLEPEIEQTVGKYVRDMRAQRGDATLRLAVRSSAVGEDGAEASAAGQNETVLGARTPDEVLAALRSCWASLYAYRSVEYRRQRLQPIDARMAVVVQQMVAADVAGVMFTRDPHGGDPRRVLVTANYGLGESVVSGNVEPDTFVVERRLLGGAGELRLVETAVGSKTHALRMADGGEEHGGEPVVSSELSADDRLRASMTEEQVLRLAAIGVRLEQAYGSARDIEWALFENEFHILQSRPVTTAHAMSNWELLHEADSAVMSPDDTFSFANVGEVLPGCVTPLTSSTVVAALQRSTMKVIDPRYRYRARFGSSFARTHHRVMFDIYQVFLVVREAKLGLMDKIQAISIAGKEFITPEMHRVSLLRNGVASAGKKLGFLVELVCSFWNNKAVVARTQRYVAALGGRYAADSLRQHFGDHDARQFAGEIDFELDDEDRLEETLGAHSHTSKVSTFTQLMAMMILVEGGSEITSAHYGDIALVLSSGSDVESAEVPAMLEEMVTAIYMAGQTAEFVAVAPADGVEWLQANCATAARMFRNFISRHGHRAFKEFELSSITWGMRPQVIIEMLQTNCRHADDNVAGRSKRTRPLTNAQIVEQLRSPRKTSTRRILGYILSLCQLSVQRRETSKSCVIAYIDELRKAYRHLAALLVADGRLTDAELIFYLTRHELERLVRAPSTTAHLAGLVAKAQRRQRLFAGWNELRFDELNSNVAQTKRSNAAADRRPDGDDDTGVRGTAVSEGVVTGRACVIGGFAECAQIRPGDILVTHSTDIAWSTYFPMLGGVVTELGGLISHGAVVAREYGLPCIVGAADATRLVRHGEQVTLDANRGMMWRVVEAEKEAVVEESEA